MTGIIGAGRMAQAVGSIAVKAGHQVMLSNSRRPKRSGVSAIGCEVGTVDDVAAFGEMLIAPIHLQLLSANPATPLKKKAALNPQNSFPHLGPVPELDSVEFATAKVLPRLLPGSKW